MAEIPAAAILAFAAVVALILYAFAWRATRTRSTGAKLLVRAVLPLAIFVPAILFATLTMQERHMSSSSPPPVGAPAPSATPPAPMQSTDDFKASEEEKAKEEQTRRFEMRRDEEEGAMKPGAPAPDTGAGEVAPSMESEEAPGAPKSAEPPEPPRKKAKANGEGRAQPSDQESGVPLDDAAPTAAAPPEPAVDKPVPPPGASGPSPLGTSTPPPPEPSTRGVDLDAKSGGGGGASGSGSAAAPGAGAPPAQEDWDIVPVYYGTDRSQAANDKRLDYGSGRGRRLELGRALVTVPKLHKVPAIERPWAVRIPYLNVTLYEEAEDPKSHFTMKEISSLTQEEFLAVVRERLAASKIYKDHAFIFIHGYNTSFDYALYRTAQIAYDLKFDGAPFAYSWPSGGGLASYTYDRESSGQSEPFLKQFVELVTKQTGAKSVSIIAHSMGNQPTLQVLKDLKASKPEGVNISQIILAAPDVDRDNFENIARDIQGLAKGVTLYAAANDRALMVSRNFYGGVPRAGDVPASGPLVLPGVDTIDVTAASMDSLGLNHSGYAENNALLADIGVLIQAGTRPPVIRTPTLEEIATAKGPYWRYRGER